MDTWKGHYLQTCGAVLQAVGAFLLVLAGNEEVVPLLFMGGISGIGGLILWGKGAREKALPPPPVTETVDRSPRLAEVIASLQEDVAHLREDREFYKELYSGRTSGETRGESYSARGPST